MFSFIISLAVAYFLGSIPSGVIIGKKFKGIDIREHGSKNTGATNAYRVLGGKLGLVVLFADILKGFLPPFIASLLGVAGWQLILVGVATIIGHTLSCFLNFKGGKGVATSLGVFIFLTPKIVLVLLLAFFLTVYFTKYVSLASCIAAGLYPILTLFMPIREGIPRVAMIVVATLVGGFVIYKHKTNIVRLKNGTENKIGTKK